MALNLDSIESRGLNGLTIRTPADAINKTLPYIFAFAGIALLIYLVLGGLQLMTAKGDPKAIQGAQAKISNALIGFVIVIISYTLVTLFADLLGLGTFGNVFN